LTSFDYFRYSVKLTFSVVSYFISLLVFSERFSSKLFSRTHEPLEDIRH